MKPDELATAEVSLFETAIGPVLEGAVTAGGNHYVHDATGWHYVDEDTFRRLYSPADLGDEATPEAVP